MAIRATTRSGLRLTLRPFHGFNSTLSYTFSKSLDYTSQNGQGVVLQDSLEPAGDKGLSDFDARNRFVVNFIYDLPFKGNRLVDGWQIGSIISDQSGNPVNLLANGAGIGGLTGLATLRPDRTGPIQIVDTPLVQVGTFNTSLTPCAIRQHSKAAAADLRYHSFKCPMF